MAFALASAFYSKDSSLLFSVCDPDQKRQQLFLENFSNCEIFYSPLAMAKTADLLILAVKPQVLEEALSPLTELEKENPDVVILSIVAGISLANLSSRFSKNPLVRLMPNAPCLVQAMAGAVVFQEPFSDEKKAALFSLLRRSGEVLEVKENQMDAVTALSGSGPAFVARLMEAFIESGEKMGLEAQTATLLTAATFSGTAKLLTEKKISPDELVQMVSSPNGTTVAGRSFLEASDYSKIIEETLLAAKIRSIELGKKDGKK